MASSMERNNIRLVGGDGDEVKEVCVSVWCGGSRVVTEGS